MPALNTAQIDELRQRWSKVKKIDATTPACKNLLAWLDGQDQDTLRLLANSNIRFVSFWARNRVHTPDPTIPADMVAV